MSDKTEAANTSQPETPAPAQNPSQPQAPATSQPSQQQAPKAAYSQAPGGSGSPAAAQSQLAPGSGNYAGHKQNYNGQNKNHYSKRNNGSYNGKPHHNAHHGNGGKQYANANANAYGYPQSMYGGNYYYGYGYPQGMVPGMNGVPVNYAPQSPQPGQTYLASGSPVVSKVKITNKDGQQVDFEEKSKSAASTPKAAPAQIATTTAPASVATPEVSASPVASPVPAAAVAAPAAAAAAAAEKATAKSDAAEEFRRRILERAQAAKKKKEEEEKAKLEAENKAKEPVAAPAAPAATPVAAPVSEPATEAPVESAEKPVEPVAEKAEQPAAEPAAEPATPAPVSTESSAKEATPEATPEPVAETASAATETPEPETAKEEETPVKSESTESHTEEDQEDSESSRAEHASDKTQDDEEEEQDDDSEDGPVFDLSSYFEKIKLAEPIEDPFTFPYPYPSTGVDARWKSDAKKYRYDPQFLLQFGDCVQYPIDDAWKEKLEHLGIVSTRKSGGSQRMGSNRMGDKSQSGRFNGSIPGRLGQFHDRQNSRSGSKRRGGASGSGGPRDKSLRNRTQSRRGKESEEPPKPAEEVKPLVASANRWVPRSRAKQEEVKLAPDGSVLLSTEDIERKVKSALNKLTLEMFEPITEDLLKIANQSIWEEDAKTIKQVISLTFAKACDEPYWSSVYAQFCAKMLKEVPEEVKDVNVLTKNGEPATGGDLARRILLATCQVEYEKGWVDKLPTNEDGSPLEPEMMSEEYYVMAAAKRRGLGLVKFIGNLYILNMLNDQVILHCLRDQSKNVVDPSEDSLENLAQLIKTVGPRFEASERNRAALSLVYDNIQLILENCTLPSRIKFMLMDLQDLRKSSWKAIKQEAGPKTIKEIHNEAELKKLEDGRAQAEKRRQNKGGFNNSGFGNDSRSNSSRGGGSSWGNKKDSRQPSKDSRGFTSVSRTQSNRQGPEPSAPAANLAPRETSKRTDAAPSNLFAALGDEDGADA